MAWKDSQIDAARKGWNLVLSVGRRNADDITDIVKEMKSGSSLKLFVVAAIDDSDLSTSGTGYGVTSKNFDAFTTEGFNRVCDTIPSGVNVTLSLPS